MVSTRGRTQQENFSTSEVSPHFYQIIRQNNIQDGNFVIPEEFVRKFGNCLTSDSIILNVPLGKSWKVELLKIGDEIWVDKGWQEFSDYHSLKHGHLVMFKYEGNYHFNLSIFDMTAVEIEYPVNEVPSRECPKQEDGDDDDDDISCEILDDFGDFTKDHRNESSKFLNKKSPDRQDRKVSSPSSSKAPKATIKIFSSKKFQVVLRYRSRVNLPFALMQNYVTKKSDTVMLRVATNSWPVKLHVYSSKNFAVLTGGWPAFFADNRMKIGDVCIFELLEKNEIAVSKISEAK